ncbi:uncharacterized protein LOC106151430 isoform X2 [Lingula anatina]|nr:uncharacterized protein LOC106151430 isoform X2 [Lingula anatina]|eukprot:XP_013381279.1 uncharacterized protein LOC106151430 isoform X2 [Lingula anatina]
MADVRSWLQSLMREAFGILAFVYIWIALMVWQLYIIVYTKLSTWFPRTSALISSSVRWAHSLISGGNTKTHVLITMPFSPFCETVRWAFDMAGEPYDERSVGPIFHYFVSLFQTLGSNRAVPIMITHPDHRVLPTSHACLRFLGDLNNERFGEDWVFPSRDAEEFEMNLSADDSYGQAVMRCVYHYFFTAKEDDGKKQLLQVCKKGISKWQSVLLPFLWPGYELIIKLSLKVDDQVTFKANIEQVDKTWDKVNQLLSDGRKYILGTRQASGADIAFAALSYPLILPTEMDGGLFSFSKDPLPPRYRKEVERRRKSAAGRFVLRLFKEERHITFQT